MPRLADGAVTGMAMQSSSDYNPVFNAQYENTTLRIGYIVRRYPPGDQRNRNGKSWEYDILVTHREGLGPTSSTTYYRCVSLCRYGQIKNFGETIYNADTELDSATNQARKFGTAVLVLCVNAASDYGVIIGTIHHPQRSAEEKVDHDVWSYHGVTQHIADDGSWSFTFAGKNGSSKTAITLDAGDGSWKHTDGTNTIEMKPQGGTLEFDVGSQVTFSVPALEIKGANPTQPIMRAESTYISTLQTLLQALTAFSAAVAALGAGITAELTLGPSKAPAGALAGVASALTAAVAAHLATLSPGIAISTTSKTS